MRNINFELFDMKREKTIYNASIVCLPEGDKMVDVISRFAVNNGNINPRIQELKAFQKYNLDFPYGLDFNKEIQESLKNDSFKMIELSLEQLKEENSLFSLLEARLSANYMKNVSLYQSIPDFFVFPQEDVSFIIESFEMGIKQGLITKERHFGIFSLCEYYSGFCKEYDEDCKNNKDLVLILTGDNFILESEYRSIKNISDFDILTNPNFKEFVLNLNPYEGSEDFYSDEDIEEAKQEMEASDYISAFLENAFEEGIYSIKPIVEYVLEKETKDNYNLITKESILNVKASELF